MTTRTQIIEGLRAAKHQHAGCCYTPEGIMCICLANQHNASIDSAIAELEKQPAEQVPVAYPSADLGYEWDISWIQDYGHGLTKLQREEYISRKAIDWYRSSTAKEVPADVLAVLEELEKLALKDINVGCLTIGISQQINNSHDLHNRDIRALTAKLRSLLGGEV